MSVTWRADRKKWQVSITVNGRRRRILRTLKKDALDIEKTAKLNALGLAPVEELARVEIGAAFGEYHTQESKPRKSAACVSNDEWYFNLANHFLTSERGLDFVDQIGLQDLEALQKWLLLEQNLGPETEGGFDRIKPAWSASSVNRAFHTYKHFFNKMCAWGKLEKNPAQYLSSLPEAAVKRESMTPAIYDQVMNYRAMIIDKETEEPILDKMGALQFHVTPDWFKDVLEFIYGLGPRGSSVERFGWPDVNFKERWLELETKKGAKALTKKIRLPMTDRMFALLIRVRNKWPEATGAVFRYDDGRPVKADRISKVGNRLIKLCGHAEVDLYGSRHGLASDLINAGVPIEVVRQLLGHSSTKTTQNYTKGTSMETLANALKLVRGQESAPDGTKPATAIAAGD
jgi:integrase